MVDLVLFGACTALAAVVVLPHSVEGLVGDHTLLMGTMPRRILVEEAEEVITQQMDRLVVTVGVVIIRYPA